MSMVSEMPDIPPVQCQSTHKGSEKCYEAHYIFSTPYLLCLIVTALRRGLLNSVELVSAR